MEEHVSIEEFRRVIGTLPADEPIDNPRVWYRTQKEHWLGWLEDYNEKSTYGRKIGQKRDARFAYNHVVNYQMLLWLIEAAGMREELVDAAFEAAAKGTTLMQRSGAIRKVVPWSEVYAMFWGEAARRSATSITPLGRLRRLFHRE